MFEKYLKFYTSFKDDEPAFIFSPLCSWFFNKEEKSIKIFIPPDTDLVLNCENIVDCGEYFKGYGKC